MKKLLAVIGVLLVLVVAGFAVYVATRQNLKFGAPFPAVAASADSAVIARGRYVVRNLAACAGCHAGPGTHDAYANGEDVPLAGGFEWNIPPGRIYARNITPDAETGIGSFSDGEVARALRHGVGRDGRALLPFMEMQGLSDEDLAAVVSYLRTQPPVRNEVPAHRFTLLGKIVKATMLANPVGARETPQQASPRGASEENGRYLAESVANCWACHTQRDMKTGQLVGPRFGGAIGSPDDRNPKRTWSPPNLTRHPTTGRLGTLSENAFVARVRMGRLIPGSPMPWQDYAGLSDDDLRAIYRYLATLPPVERDTGPAFADKP
jgi:mono/diheme cytochrome c family protein